MVPLSSGLFCRAVYSSRCLFHRGTNKPDDVQSRVRRVVKELETMNYEEGSRKLGKEDKSIRRED